MNDRRNPARPDGKVSRRQVMVGAAVVLGDLAMRSAHASPTVEVISRGNEAIHQVTIFKASRRRVYEALTDAKQFHQLTLLSGAALAGMAIAGRPAEIATEAGGAFALFGGYLTGRHIELVPHERIVQAWRTAKWDPGVYSVVKFDLHEEGSGTRLVFDHTGFPEGEARHLAAGWKENYWEPLEKYLA